MKEKPWQLIKSLPWDDLIVTYRELVAGGAKPKDAARDVARTVDAMFDFDKIVSGTAGTVLEAIDRPVIRLAVTVALTLAGHKAPAAPEPEPAPEKE